MFPQKYVMNVFMSLLFNILKEAEGGHDQQHKIKFANEPSDFMLLTTPSVPQFSSFLSFLHDSVEKHIDFPIGISL